MRPTAPNTLRAFSWAFAVTCALMSGVGAGNLDGMYDNQELAELQPRYERGWRNNYKEFFLPVFTAPERTRFSQVQIHFEPPIGDLEPMAFFATGDNVYASTASLKFLFEITLAERWLDMNGFARTSLSDYLTMLRYWDPSRGRPPKPLQTLCIPPKSSMDPKIVESAEGIFNDASYFVLLHEYGHALYRHPRKRSRAAGEIERERGGRRSFRTKRVCAKGEPAGGSPLVLLHSHSFARIQSGCREPVATGIVGIAHTPSIPRAPASGCPPDRGVLRCLRQRIQAWRA